MVILVGCVIKGMQPKLYVKFIIFNIDIRVTFQTNLR